MIDSHREVDTDTALYSAGRETNKEILRQRAMDKKANQEYVDTKMEALTSYEIETRAIALSAKKPHECLQSKVIDRLVAFMDNIRTIKLAATIGVAIMIGNAVYQYMSQESRNDATDGVIVQVQSYIKRVDEKVDSIAQKPTETISERNETKRDLVDAVTNAVIEASTKPRRRN